MSAFPARASLFPAGVLSPASFKTLLAAWYDATTGLLGTAGTAAAARDGLGVGSIGNRNRFTNGGFDIDQRNEGAAASVAGGPTFGPDRWSGIGVAAAGVYTLQRIADTARPGKFRMKISVTTADAALAAGDIYAVRQRIAAKNVRDWLLGTASAKTVTISFEIESEVTGTFGVRLTNNAANRSYIGLITVNVANTREQKTVTLQLDTSGTWAIGTAIGLEVSLCLAAGTTYQGVAGWQAGNLFTTSAQTNFMATIGNDMYLANMQIEEGTITSPVFEEPEISEMERRCYYHYRKSFPRGTVPAASAGTTGSHTMTQIVGASAAQNGHKVQFDSPMGSAPTVTLYNPSAAGAQVRNLATSTNCTGSTTGAYENGFVIDLTTPAATAAGQALAVHWTAEWEL